MGFTITPVEMAYKRSDSLSQYVKSKNEDKSSKAATFSYGAYSFSRNGREVENKYNATSDYNDSFMKLLLRKLNLSSKYLNNSLGQIKNAYCRNDWSNMDKSHEQITPNGIKFTKISYVLPFVDYGRANTYRSNNPYTESGEVNKREIHDPNRDNYRDGYHSSSYGYSFLLSEARYSHNKAKERPANTDNFEIREDGEIYRKNAESFELKEVVGPTPESIREREEYEEYRREAILEAAQNGVLVDGLTSFLRGEGFRTSALRGDLEGRMELFSNEIGRFMSVCDEVFGEDMDAESKRIIQSVLDEAIDKVSSRYAEIYSDYLGKGGDRMSLKQAFTGILTQRADSYHELYSSGKAELDYDGQSAVFIMYDAMVKGEMEDSYNISIDTDMGAISYEDLSRTNESIYILENVEREIKNGPNYYFQNPYNTETIGVCLGIAKMQVGALDNGSALMQVTKNASNRRIDQLIDTFIDEAEGKKSPINNYRNIVTRNSINSVLDMFDDVLYGDVNKNIEKIMDELTQSYKDKTYTGLYQKGQSIECYNSAEDQDRRKFFDGVLEEIRAELSAAKRSNVNFVHMARWNEWVSTNSFIKDPSKYLLSSRSQFDYSV